MKTLLTFALFFLLAAQCHAQNSTADLVRNYMKYWKARGRLIGDENNRDQHNGFMVVGNETGMSIPAEYRIPNKPNSYPQLATTNNIGFPYYDQPNDCYSQTQSSNWSAIDLRDGKTKSGFLNWGDATIGIAHYLISLSYEWQLLNRAGESKVQTEKEIYYALKALQRLDLYAETLIPKYGTNVQPNYNGFFVRDDVPGNFAIAKMGKNYDLVRSDRSCGDGTGSNNEESWDQVIAITLGLAVVDRLVPTNISVNGENLIDINKDIMRKISTYIANNGWIIHNPVTGWDVSRGAQGGILWAYPLSVAAKRVIGANGAWNSQFAYLGFSKTVWSTYKRAARASLNPVAVSWTQALTTAGGLTNFLVSLPSFPPQATDDNRNDNITMVLEMAIASRTAGVEVSFGNTFNPFAYLGNGSDPDGKALINAMCTRYKKEFFELLGSNMIGYDYGYAGQNNYWTGEFNKFPCACNCIFQNPEMTLTQTDDSGCANAPFTTSTQYPSYGNTGWEPDYLTPYPWTTPNRWAHWRRDPLSERFKEFNGVDYLESFGAYLYKFHENMGLWGRLRVGWSGTLPFNYNGTTIGTQTNPMVLKGVFDVLSDSKLDGNQSAVLKLYAGSKVELLPGFDAQKNTILDAAIVNYDCNPEVYSSGTVFHRGTAEDSGSNSNFEGTDFTGYLIDTNIAVHYDAPDYIADTLDEAHFDTSIYFIRKLPDNDTIFVGLKPCYAFDENLNLINICDAQARRLPPAYFSAQALTIAPNPATEESFVRFGVSEATQIRLTLFDVLGRNVSENIDPFSPNLSAGQYNLRISTTNLPAGIYSLLIQLGNETLTRKISVVH